MRLLNRFHFKEQDSNMIHRAILVEPNLWFVDHMATYYKEEEILLKLANEEWELINLNSKKENNKNIFSFLPYYLLFGALMAILFFGIVSGNTSDYARANRYRNCFEKLSVTENLEYEEMKEICSHYLK